MTAWFTMAVHVSVAHPSLLVAFEAEGTRFDAPPGVPGIGGGGGLMGGIVLDPGEGWAKAMWGVRNRPANKAKAIKTQLFNILYKYMPPIISFLLF